MTEWKNEPVVHENGGFRGCGPGYLLYLHDVLRFLETIEEILTNIIKNG